MKKPKIYFAKTLFSGAVVGKDPKTLYIGIPGGQQYKTEQNFSKEKNFKVMYNGEKMIIENWHKADAYRKFDDISGRGLYTLAYFLWNPIIEKKYKFEGNTAIEI